MVDPSKENAPQRQLLPYWIGLQMAEPTQVTMIHGHGAKDRGSLCDEIPFTTRVSATCGKTAGLVPPHPRVRGNPLRLRPDRQRYRPRPIIPAEFAYRDEFR
ncbi:hypothetical protein ACIRRA_06855 [Nocardia sp. NPDC101769]|uniref:hypothetical protein n=1 Tax=Nocardia sp. NPDC101769 TaxID=3364333 RepID=UPI0038279226